MRSGAVSPGAFGSSPEDVSSPGLCNLFLVVSNSLASAFPGLRLLLAAEAGSGGFAPKCRDPP